MKKMTYGQLKDALYNYNVDNGYTTKGTPTSINGVVVIDSSSFDKDYSLKSRSYRVSSDNKAFLPNMISNSVFASSLDGTDVGVRLDWYIPDEWTVDYCYIEEEVTK